MKLLHLSIWRSANSQSFSTKQKGRSMVTKLANEEEKAEGSSQIIKNVVPVNQVYRKKTVRIFPSYAVKDYEETITLKANNQNVSVNLFTNKFFKGFVKKQHKFMHLGVVQISIKPILGVGLGAPVVVCLRDARHLNLENSLLALVESNLSKGPFYFNCFPSFSVSLADPSSLEVLTLYIMTSGIPLALTYRLVCKAVVGLSSETLKEPVLGETTYFQPTTGTPSTTKWDELQVPESWMRNEEPKKGGNFFETLPDGRMIVRIPSAREADDDDEYDALFDE